MRETSAILGPLLQSPQRNPHATLITVFINAVMEIAGGNEESIVPRMDIVMEYLPTPDILQLGLPHNADMMRIWDARTLVLDTDRFFQRYTTLHKFSEITADLRVAAKKVNTIVDKCPMELKLRPGQKGAQQEFDILFSSNFTGTERYVEWQTMN